MPRSTPNHTSGRPSAPSKSTLLPPSNSRGRASISASSPPLLQPGAVSSTHPSSPATPCCCSRRANGRGTKAASSNLKQHKNCKTTERVASRHLASTNLQPSTAHPTLNNPCNTHSRGQGNLHIPSIHHYSSHILIYGQINQQLAARVIINCNSKLCVSRGCSLFRP